MSEDIQITLVTKEGIQVSVSSRICSLSILIKNVLEDLDESSDIPVPHLTKPVLDKILEFCEHHNFVPPPQIQKPIPASLSDGIEDQWDVEYIQSLSFEDLTQLMIACNYLDMRCLLDLCMACVASHFKSKNIDELRREFNISQEFTESEQQRILKENPWVQEDKEERLKAGK